MPLATILAATLFSQKPTVEFHTQFETEKDKFSLKFTYPYFLGKSKLEEFANKAVRKPLDTAEKEFIDATKELTETPTSPWELEIKGTVSLQTSKLISVLYERYEYAGGAHPNTFTHCVNVGLINGKPQMISLKDILAPGVNSSMVIDGLVKPNLAKQKLARVNEPLTDFPDNSEVHFIISKNGLTFPFDKYTVGPYVEGEYIVKLTWKDLKGKINTNLIQQAIK